MCLETSVKITFFNPYKFAKGSKPSTNLSSSGEISFNFGASFKTTFSGNIHNSP
jgi:hypothetical protein